MAALLRRPELYPLFMKEVGGKYSLSVISTDGYDDARDEVVLLDGTRHSPDALAGTLTAPGGHLVQRRLRQAPALAELFGPRLWSVRLLALDSPSGTEIHSAVAKIATGTNPADNYCRPGNMLGAIELETGTIWQDVSGTGAGLSNNPSHPNTRRPIFRDRNSGMGEDYGACPGGCAGLRGGPHPIMGHRSYRSRPRFFGGKFWRRPQPGATGDRQRCSGR